MGEKRTSVMQLERGKGEPRSQASGVTGRGLGKMVEDAHPAATSQDGSGLKAIAICDPRRRMAVEAYAARSGLIVVIWHGHLEIDRPGEPTSIDLRHAVGDVTIGALLVDDFTSLSAKTHAIFELLRRMSEQNQVMHHLTLGRLDLETVAKAVVLDLNGLKDPDERSLAKVGMQTSTWPFGFEKSTEGNLKIHEGHAQALRLAFLHAAAGRNLHEVRSVLNSACMPFRDKPWPLKGVSALLRNTVFLGFRR